MQSAAVAARLPPQPPPPPAKGVLRVSVRRAPPRVRTAPTVAVGAVDGTSSSQCWIPRTIRTTAVEDVAGPTPTRQTTMKWPLISERLCSKSPCQLHAGWCDAGRADFRFTIFSLPRGCGRGGDTKRLRGTVTRNSLSSQPHDLSSAHHQRGLMDRHSHQSSGAQWIGWRSPVVQLSHTSLLARLIVTSGVSPVCIDPRACPTCPGGVDDWRSVVRCALCFIQLSRKIKQ